MDLRLLIVLLPVVLAASWAVYNIGIYAIAQFKNFMNKPS